MLRRRRLAFLACALLIPLCALIALKQTTPRYTATGALIYEPSEYKGRELQSVLQSDPTTEAVMASQAEILHSLHIAEGVTAQLHLFNDPEFNPTPAAARACCGAHLRRLGLRPGTARPTSSVPAWTTAVSTPCWRCGRHWTRTR